MLPGPRRAGAACRGRLNWEVGLRLAGREATAARGSTTLGDERALPDAYQALLWAAQVRPAG